MSVQRQRVPIVVVIIALLFLSMFLCAPNRLETRRAPSDQPTRVPAKNWLLLVTCVRRRRVSRKRRTVGHTRFYRVRIGRIVQHWTAQYRRVS